MADSTHAAETAPSADSAPSAEVRAELTARLRPRTGEIEEAILQRIGTVPGEEIADDDEFLQGLRAAVSASVEYALAVLEEGDDSPVPIPAAATTQARRAARFGISLETLLRRYAAGDRILADFALGEAQDLPEEETRRLLRAQGPWLDRFLAAVAAEHSSEMESIGSSPSRRTAELVQALLDGERVGGEELEYDLDGWHLGLIATGGAAEQAVRTLAAALDRRLLAVPREGGDVIWAWLGGRHPLSMEEVERRHGALVPEGVSLAVGEPREGRDGWRLTHHEARAAWRVMARQPQPLVRGRDSLLLAAVLREEDLAQSLLRTYLAPFDADADGGEIARGTLRAYLEANCNANAAAAALEVDRHTVKRRLERIEGHLGRVLHECHAELEVALALERLGVSDQWDMMGHAEGPNAT